MSIAAAGLISVGAAATGGTAAASARQSLPATYLSPLTPAQIQQLSANATDKVIVILRNQEADAPDMGSLRSSRLASDQSPLLGEFHELHSAGVHGYSSFNEISATISSAEAARLRQNPAVLAVVADAKVQAPDSTPQVVSTPVAASSQSTASASSGTVAGECPSNPSQPILEPEALQSMYVDFGPGSSQPDAHDYADGSGVKVAVFPDGLDPNIPDFRRDGGTGPSAIFDYQDFTGEGKFGVTGGEEAFGDASSIISQGNEVFDLSKQVNPSHPLPSGCTIRIEGVAPGASLAVMKVFGDTNFAFNSEILQGIDWAINHDHVNVLSQSFGGNPVPNLGSDPIAVADADAVAAGITVVASSGDAGVTNTIGTPAVVPGVISAAASTDYRLYQQTTSYGIQCWNGLKCTKDSAQEGDGWVDDQVSGLSSSGVTEANNTVSVLAPGEANWIDCSKNLSTYTECGDAYGGTKPQPIIAFGGTSESAPLTAGVAALVIQSYRLTHSGSTPTPAVVQQIIMSSAQDLDTRADDQGAGLVDALRAVEAARSYKLSSNSSNRIGDSLVYSPNAINEVGATGSTTVTPVTVTNGGASSQTVAPWVRALGPATTIAQGKVSLDQSVDPTFLYQGGYPVGDVHSFTFNVPSGTDRLAASIAWNSNQTQQDEYQTIRFDLFDPEGRLVSQSRPQGPVGSPGGGFSLTEVHNAQPGTWRFLIFDTNFAYPSLPDQYSGPLAYQITSQSFQTVANSVSPSSVVLAPGASQTFDVTTTTPSTPGDNSESLVFGSPSDGGPAWGTVPITLRSLATVGQSFSGTMTGGNSRMSFYGQELPYEFTVASGKSDIDADISIGDPGYIVLAFLVNPAGLAVDIQSSQLWDGSGTNTQKIHLSWQNPQAGTWGLDIVQEDNVDSLEVSTPFSATLSYNTVKAHSNVPDSSSVTLPAGKTKEYTLWVTNTGNSPEGYIVDARHDNVATVSLGALFANPASEPLPVSNGADIPQFVVPPFSSSLTMVAQSTVPITLDTSADFGAPDVEATSSDHSAVAAFSASPVTASIWSCAPSEQGPFTKHLAKSTTYSCSASATTNAFAADVSTSAGDAWSDLEGITSGTYNPLILNPGQSAPITVAITPSGSSGTVVQGFLALETYNNNTFSSDELVTFPFSYTVG
jgi:hypothetical protein